MSGGTKRRKQVKKSRAAKEREQEKMVQHLQLKNIAPDIAKQFLGVFTVLDETDDPEEKRKQGVVSPETEEVEQVISQKMKGYLTQKEAFTWFRSLGWVWSDEQLVACMKREVTLVKVDVPVFVEGKQNAKSTRTVEGYSVAALLRLADTYYPERFNIAREEDRDLVRKTFDVFSKDGTIMRADLVKVLTDLKATPDDINMMLEELRYKSSALTFKIDDPSDDGIVDRVCSKIAQDVSRLPDDHDDFAL